MTHLVLGHNTFPSVLVNLSHDVCEGPIFKLDLSDDVSDCACSTIKNCSEEDATKPMPSIPFINRVQELSDIQNAGPVVLIDAPSGLGKTALLKELQRKYESGGWLCLSIDLGRCKTKRLVQDALNHPFAPQGREAQTASLDMDIIRNLGSTESGVILLFDSVEQLPEDVISWLLGTFIPTCAENLAVHPVRIILAGRYLEAKDSKIARVLRALRMSSPDRYLVFKLSPFGEQAIVSLIKTLYETSQRPKRKLSSGDLERWAKEIMRLSGGHPASIMDLAKELSDGWIFPTTEEAKLKWVEEYVLPQIDITLDELDAITQHTLEVLSIFRSVNVAIVQHLIDRELLDASDGLEVLSSLARTGLVAKSNDNLFYRDGITRRLLLIRMRVRNPDKHERLNNIAHQYYVEELRSLLDESQQRFMRHGVAELFESMTAESLYHCCERLSDFSARTFGECLRINGPLYARALGMGEQPESYRKRLVDIIKSDQDIHEKVIEKKLDLDMLMELAFPTIAPSAEPDKVGTLSAVSPPRSSVQRVESVPSDKVSGSHLLSLQDGALSLEQRKQFKEVLSSAFDVNGIANLLKEALNLDIEDIVVPGKDGNKETIINKIEGHCISTGKLMNLVRTAYKRRPDNIGMHDFIRDNFPDLFSEPQELE